MRTAVSFKRFHDFKCPFLTDDITKLFEFVDLSFPFVPEIGKLLRLGFDDIILGEVEVLKVKHELVNMPKLVEIESESIGGSVSEELSGRGNFESVLIDIYKLVLLKVLQKQSEVNQLRRVVVGLKGQP